MNPRVLIIDDEVPILNGIKLNLGRTFDLTLANGGEEALKAVEEEEPYEVVVSDMRMPGMTGVEVLAKIKSIHPTIQTILLTGHADFEFGGSQALQSGQLFRILSKPCPPNKLKEAIEAAVRAKARKDADNGQYGLAINQIDEALAILPANRLSIALISALYKSKQQVTWYKMGEAMLKGQVAEVQALVVEYQEAEDARRKAEAETLRVH